MPIKITHAEVNERHELMKSPVEDAWLMVAVSHYEERELFIVSISDDLQLFSIHHELSDETYLNAIEPSVTYPPGIYMVEGDFHQNWSFSGWEYEEWDSDEFFKNVTWRYASIEEIRSATRIKPDSIEIVHPVPHRNGYPMEFPRDACFAGTCWPQWDLENQKLPETCRLCRNKIKQISNKWYLSQFNI